MVSDIVWGGIYQTLEWNCATCLCLEVGIGNGKKHMSSLDLFRPHPRKYRNALRSLLCANKYLKSSADLRRIDFFVSKVLPQSLWNAFTLDYLASFFTFIKCSVEVPINIGEKLFPVLIYNSHKAGTCMLPLKDDTFSMCFGHGTDILLLLLKIVVTEDRGHWFRLVSVSLYANGVFINIIMTPDICNLIEKKGLCLSDTVYRFVSLKK